MKVIIDRFEEDFAVVECGDEVLNLPRRLVGDAKEGDALLIEPLSRNADLLQEEELPHCVFERLRHKKRRRNSRR